ncbi:MAG: rod shape-determining protein MreC [Acidobacteriota bacterium]
MAILDLRQRAGSVFFVVMLGHILLISMQVNSRKGVPILEAVTFAVFADVQRGISGGFSGVGRLWSGYVALRHLKRDNDELRRALDAARVETEEQRALAGRTRTLEQLLGLRDRSSLKTVSAEIIAAGATPDFRTVTIDRGTRDAVRPNMAVIAPAGVVGRVVVPSGRAAKVQLLVDRNAAAGALIERSRAQGVVVGNGDGRLRLEYVSEVSDIAVGDRVVTSGIDGIYPKGYPIGQVEAIERSGGGYKAITIRPAVDFSSLEDVLVVLGPAEAPAAPDAAETADAGAPE